MSSNEPSSGRVAALRPPNVTLAELLKQFWADSYGKEVQTAATYSYTWLADQFGHICIGVLVVFAATLLAGWAMVLLGLRPNLEYRTGLVPGFVVTLIGVSIWEWAAYNSAVKHATKAFPLDTGLLRDNAIVAAGYMALGALLGLAFHLSVVPALLISAVVLIVAIALAPRWLRQKIIWQKASIPYVFRLADVTAAIAKKDANTLQSLIEAGAPPNTQPSQMVIGGPTGSGRTSMAAGIGTEFAFRANKVRYLSLNALLEFAAGTRSPEFLDDFGPTTISYWPWCEAQVVIIDDIGPIIATDEPQSRVNLTRFRSLLQNELTPIASTLSRCHTVWVVGDLSPPVASGTLSATLDDLAKAVAKYCGNQHDPLVVELGQPPQRAAAKGTILPTTRGTAQTAVVGDVRRVGRLLEPAATL